MKLYDYDGFIWLIGTILITIFVNVLLLHLLSLVYEKDANLLVVQLGFADRKVHENAENVDKIAIAKYMITGRLDYEFAPNMHKTIALTYDCNG